MKCLQRIKKMFYEPRSHATPEVDYTEHDKRLQEVRVHLHDAADRAEKAANLLRELVKEKGLP